MNKENEFVKRLETLEARINKLEKGEEKEGVSMSERVNPTAMMVNSMSYCGKYESPDGKMHSNFGANIWSITDMLKANTKALAQVIDAFASEERLDIIKLLLKKSLTAKEIMEILDFATTGKVYHHLSFLEKLGIIQKKGEEYSISGEYVSCVLLVIAGVSKIIEKRGV